MEKYNLIMAVKSGFIIIFLIILLFSGYYTLEDEEEGATRDIKNPNLRSEIKLLGE